MWSLRAKLVAIAGTAATAFLVLIVVSSVSSERVQRQLERIEDVFLPLVQLGPQLEHQFSRLTRGLQDAVAASDPDALAATRALERDFVAQLEAAGSAVDPAAAAALRAALADYYLTALDVSRRLIEGETGEALVVSIEAMQARQRRVGERIARATRLDRGELAAAFTTAAAEEAAATRVRLVVSLACLAVVVLLSVWLGRGVFRSLGDLSAGFERFGRGAFDRAIPDQGRDELAAVARRANEMAQKLQRLAAERDRDDWLRDGHAGLAQELRGELEPAEVADRAVRFLARYVGAAAVVLYVAEPGRVLRVLSHYAAPYGPAPGTAVATAAPPTAESAPVPSFRFGEGLVGQAALGEAVLVVNDPPADYLRVRSGLGEAPARAIVLVPLVHAGNVTGVVELALLEPWSGQAQDLVLSLRETLAIALDLARGRAALQALLAETQAQTERLAHQDEELRATNDELYAQQEELRQANEALTVRTDELERQRRTLQESNTALDEARRTLEQKAAELATVSAFKSQFLANMSHELRTPLNSMLLLSNLLAENETGNLTGQQVEYCRTIHSAGGDLLSLINQVLDLAKIEAGKQDVRWEAVRLDELLDRARRVFEPLARDKGLALTVERAPGLPETLRTDRRRVDQILTNLIGNAVKFTPSGTVAVRFGRPDPAARFSRASLRAGPVLALSVADTGPGIPPEHQERVFAPFEQLEGNADRPHGGTGLGLTLARELAALLGGELQLESAPGQGSTFTCYVPENPPADGPPADRPSARTLPVSAPAGANPASADPAPAAAPPEPGPPYLLLIEDDRTFADTFEAVIREYGLECRRATDGRTGLRIARERPPSGVILDVGLPDMDGFAVMEALRADPRTARVPVHFVSGMDAAERGLAMGAVGYLVKPATRRDLVGVLQSLVPQWTAGAQRVLVVEDDAPTGESLLRLLAGENLTARHVTSARAALEALRRERVGCLILDLSLPDMDGLELLRLVEEQCGPAMPAIVVYTGRPLSRAETKRLEAYTEAIVLKEGPSAERVLNEVRLFVRRLKEGLGPRRPVAPQLPAGDLRLDGRRVLIVDDDMRTAYALSAALRARGAEVSVADTGRAALAVLAEQPAMEAVLMDIMMPEMDGYEAMRAIRRDARFRDLPVIALTAKAMKGDAEKCIAAGASDYLTKPVDTDRLLALLRTRLGGSRPR